MTIPMSPQILIVEDDQTLGKQLVRCLMDLGLVVRWVQRGDEALEQSLDRIDLVLLDLTLPGADGLTVLRVMRRRADVPVMVLTGRARDVVEALEAGADDYLTKPFFPDELAARVRARLRRPGLARDNLIRFGELAIDRVGRLVTVAGVRCELTRAEAEILLTLARRPGAAISRAHLIDAALDPAKDASDRTLDVHISRLRQKLGSESARIETVRGIGYRLRAATS